MSTTGFLLGGMLGRIAGPIAQDFFKYKTRLGREIASREEDSKRRASLFELENKKKLSDHEHELKLLQLQQQFIDKFCKSMSDSGYTVCDSDESEMSYILRFAEKSKWVAIASELYGEGGQIAQADAGRIAKMLGTYCMNTEVIDSDCAAMSLYSNDGMDLSNEDQKAMREFPLWHDMYRLNKRKEWMKLFYVR